MSTIVVYKSKYGATKAYAQWIARELGCEAVEMKNTGIDKLMKYDNIVYGGGLYAEMIAGIALITKNFDKLTDKKIAIFSTGITPLGCREYYDGEVMEKNFKQGLPQNARVFNFMGKMILEEMNFADRTAIKMLKKVMSGKKNPTEMEKLLIELCETYGDFTDRNQINDLVEYIKG